MGILPGKRSMFEIGLPTGLGTEPPGVSVAGFGFFERQFKPAIQALVTALQCPFG